ncbi:MAG: hypothetical protein AAGE84_08920 [Cyanobacteria bacterium P01_G01_bin.39]
MDENSSREQNYFIFISQQPLWLDKWSAAKKLHHTIIEFIVILI